MNREERIRDSVNRRLSGLEDSPARRSRIRAAIREQEQEVTLMKRKTPAALVFALILVTLMASLAIADSMNLFDFFGQHDGRYASVAGDSAVTDAQSAHVEDAHLGQVEAAIDSAWFDGLTMSLAFRIANGTGCEPYIPTEDELASMEKISMPIHDVLQGEPGWEIVMAYNQAVENGTPYGYRHYSVYPSDHTTTDDGVDIPPRTASSRYDENGDYCELREFGAMLPEAIRGRDSLQLNIRLYQSETLYYFDGTDCYYKTQRCDAGVFTAVVDKTPDQTRRFAGEGVIGGVACRAEAEVGRLGGTLRIECDAALKDFLDQPPEAVDFGDCWTMLTITDEDGRDYRVSGGVPVDQRRVITSGLSGTGELPQSLTVCLYSEWEGCDEPDLTQMDVIPLQPIP